MGVSRRQSALIELVKLFRRNGVLRVPDVEKRAKNPRTYKKGYEIRFVANSKQELHRIECLLRKAGLPVAASFAKAHRYVQPLYGKQHVQQFQQTLEQTHT